MGSKRGVVAATVVLAACSKPETPPSDPAPEAAAEVQTVTPPKTANAVSIDAWGVELVLPDGATHTVEADAGRVTIAIARDEQAVLRKVDAPAPPDVAAAAVRWNADGGQDRRTLVEGVTDSGVLYRAHTFRVRVGYPNAAAGGVVHTWNDVTRVHGILALDDASHIECTAYLEYGHEITADDAGVQRALALCQSMRAR